MKKLKTNKCHLVTHSFAGVDARAAISMYGLGGQVKSLTTICSPHHGMALVDKSENEGYQYGSMEHMDRVFEILGITRQAALEFSTHNLAAFNSICPNNKSTSYYSLGAKKSGRTMNDILRHGHDVIVN